jgi:coenzyme F420-reducing hydrogenase beta subunit
MEKIDCAPKSHGDEAMGIVKTPELKVGALYLAKAAKKFPGVQDGGVATCLLGYALDIGIIKGMIVMGKDAYWNAFPVIVTDSKELEKYVGSIYFPINSRDFRAKVRRSIDIYEDIGVVVTPCELKILSVGSNAIKYDEICLKIGLFCLGSFNPKEFWDYVGKGIKREEIKRFEINKDLKLIDEKGKIVLQRPIKEAHEFSVPWCKKCPDFLPEAADLSIGAGPEKGTCAVYLQTTKGLEIFERAYKNSLLIVWDVPTKFKERFEKTLQQKRAKNPSKLYNPKTPDVILQG